MFKNHILKIFLLLFVTLNINTFYSLFFSLDNISNNLIFLSLLVILMCTLDLKKTPYLFFMTMFLMVSIILFFASNSFFIFYFFFELSLLPIIFMILGWGYQVERIQASFFLLLYMIFFSFPFLFTYLFVCGMKMNFFICLNMTKELPTFMLFFIIGVFLVKCPLYFFHFWLPKAHVEASVTGSMILAGVLLKMGTFGVYRFLIFMNHLMTKKMITLLMFGVILSIIFCLMQSDFKALIAYSSVNHMSFMVLSMFTYFVCGFKGAILMMIIHGIVSPLMFFAMNLFFYHSFNRIFYFSQFIYFMSKNMSMMIFCLLVLNLNFPILISFLSEILLLFNVYFFDKMFLMAFIFLSMFLCYYTIFMLINMLYGKMKFFFSKIMTSLKNSMNMFFYIFISIGFIMNFVIF